MITLKTTVNHVLRETTVTATDSCYGYLCAETTGGTGARVAVRLAEAVRAQADKHMSRLLVASGTTATETRLLAGRLS